MIALADWQRQFIGECCGGLHIRRFTKGYRHLIRNGKMQSAVWADMQSAPTFIT
ncbi:hypothetical protein [Pasteurella testudinis]|uniref:hypothetical protein n=1 Tax=Pasteurella testudinis TaxID=761 RepID=UPI00405A2C23